MRSTIRRLLAQRAERRRAEDVPPFLHRVYVVDAARRYMAEESEAKAGLETGGVLVGFFDPRLHAVVVTHASGPGPKARHWPNRFNRDAEFCQAFLDRHAEASSGVLDFVGEWHKHRDPDPWPSLIDERTYRSLACNPDCHLDQVLVLITGTEQTAKHPRRDRYIRVNGFLFRTDGFAPREVRPLPNDAYMDLLMAE